MQTPGPECGRRRRRARARRGEARGVTIAVVVAVTVAAVHGWVGSQRYRPTYGPFTQEVLRLRLGSGAEVEGGGGRRCAHLTFLKLHAVCDREVRTARDSLRREVAGGDPPLGRFRVTTTYPWVGLSSQGCGRNWYSKTLL